jgi:hypothetical protein
MLRVTALSCLSAALFTGGVVRGEDPKPAGPSPAEMQAMMQAWTKYATPGPEHKELATFAGEWDVEVTDFTMGPNPTKSKGTCTNAMIMGGRYLQMAVKMEMMGQQMEGFQLVGFDNAKKQYHSLWIDNMGTGVATSTGTSTDGGKTIEYRGTMTDPATGKDMAMRSVGRKVSDDRVTFEMFGRGPDGKDAKMIEIAYTRRK